MALFSDIPKKNTIKISEVISHIRLRAMAFLVTHTYTKEVHVC